MRKTIVIDTKDSKYIDIIANDLALENPEVEVIKGELKGTARLTKSSYFYKLLYTEAILLVGFTLIMFGKYWYEKYKNIRRVYTLLGIPIIKVITYEEIEVIIVNVVSLAVAIFTGYWLKIFEKAQLEYTLWIGIIVTFFSCALILIFLFIECIYVHKSKTKIRKLK